MKNFLLFTFCLLISSVAFGQGSETFENANPALPGSYSDASFVGDNSVTWTFVESRNDGGYEINGEGLMLRRSTEPSSLSATVSGGIGNFTCSLLKAFTGSGNRQVELFVNGVSKGTSIAFDNTSVQTFSVSGINESGTVTIEIRNITSKQVVIDDISWTGYSASAPEILVTAISGNTNETGTTATFDVTLNTAPATDVVLNVTSGNINENTVSPATLTFTTGDYNVPQTVTITGVDDAVVDGDQTTTITVATDDAASDDDYDGLSKTVDVINEDDECTITGVTVASTSCNGDNAEFVVSWTVTSGSGNYEVDIDGNGYQTITNGGTYIITGPTTSATGVTVTVRDVNEITCLGTTTVDIPECPLTLPDVVITEVADPSDNTNKRMVEVCNRGASAVDITGWKLNGDFNGNTDVDFTVNVSGSVTLAAGECYVFANNNFPSADLSACAGSTLSGSISTNGNESFWLNDGTQNIDFYDGINSNFADSKATRNGTVTTPNPTFNASEWTVASATAADITPCSDATLPVELLHFSAKTHNQTAILTWSTASEENNAYFNVQRSLDGINFETIGRVEGAGTTYDVQEYTFIDESPVNGVNYYRLHQVDFDGQFENHKTLAVMMSNTLGGIDIAPTVVTNDFNIIYKEAMDSEITVTIYNMNGQLVRSEIVQANGNMNTIDVSLLNAGVYVVSIKNATTVVTKRIVKQ